MTASVSIREVVNPEDAAIDGFGRMQTAAYFAPETLIPSRYIPQMLSGAGETGARRNFLIVAELEDRVVGGTLFHWLADAGSGFSSFLGVAQELRRQGIARRLHEARFAALDRAASTDRAAALDRAASTDRAAATARDAALGRAAGQDRAAGRDRAAAQAPGVFIDVVSPERLPPAELAREQQAGSDPRQRRHAFARLGFRQVDVRYEQPVGGPNGGPVTILDLLFCPRAPAESVPTALVVATMRAYWTPWLGPEAASRHARDLESRAHDRPTIKLLPP